MGYALGTTVASELDGKEIDVPCRHCGQGGKVLLGQLERRAVMECGACGKPTYLDAGQFRQQVRAVEEALRDVRRQLSQRVEQQAQAVAAAAELAAIKPEPQRDWLGASAERVGVRYLVQCL